MKAFGRWQVTLPDESYVWEPDEVLLGECLMIEREAGTSYDQWISDVASNRAVACQVLVWFLRRKAGKPQEERIGVEFPIRKLDITEIVEEAGEDPEASAGSEPATESPSLASTESDPGSGSS